MDALSIVLIILLVIVGYLWLSARAENLSNKKLSERIKGMENSLDELNLELEEGRDGLKKLRSEYLDFSEKKYNEVKQLTIVKVGLENKIENLENEIEKCDDELKEKDERIKQLENELDNKMRDFNDIVSKHEILVSEYAETEKELTYYKELNDDKDIKLRNLHERINELESN